MEKSPGCRAELLAIPLGKGVVAVGAPRGKLQKLPPVGGLAADGGHQLRRVGRFVKGTVGILPGSLVLFQPPGGIGVALELFVDLQHQLHQCPVIPAGTEGIGKLGFRFIHGFIKLLQRPLQHTPPHQRRLVLIQHAEIRREGVGLAVFGKKVGIFPEKRGTKGVHGLDVRLIDPQELALEMFVGGVLGHAFTELRGNLAAKLRRRSLGIGDDEKIVNGAVLLRHIEEQPLHQHLGLAGAGSSGDQKASTAVFHHGLLLGC